MKDGRMKRKRFTEEQVLAVLKEHEATSGRSGRWSATGLAGYLTPCSLA